MAEAEEVVTDVARHATVYARDLWHRYRRQAHGDTPPGLADVAQRLSLLVASVFGEHHPIRVAQTPPPPTLLASLFGSRRGPQQRLAVPATDGRNLWLPAAIDNADRRMALQTYRTMALQQAMRASRGSAACAEGHAAGLQQDLYLLLEAFAADEALAGLLPGMVAPLNALRQYALRLRPPLSRFPAAARPLERYLRAMLQSDCGSARTGLQASDSAAASYRRAAALAEELCPVPRARQTVRLLRDCWTGSLFAPDADASLRTVLPQPQADAEDRVPRSGHLARRPEVREATEHDDDSERDPGSWMIQADEPHEKAEDPMGVQRPTDRDEHPDSDQLGDMLSELPQARLVSTPGRPREYLLSDDPPPSRTVMPHSSGAPDAARYRYPEWDYRGECYREPGATVYERLPQSGPRAWVQRTLTEHRTMLELIRRRFEMLRAERVVMRRQLEGDEIDLSACIDALADLRAGTRMPEELYQRCRPAERDIAIMLLIDVSGSTDGWVSAHRRIIDVEREALLLVCIALREMGDPYAVQAFSGEGPGNVTVRPIMNFGSRFDDDVALRIAALEPEQYTRAGAAIRHATARLMRQSAGHRLLLLLSDGKPNDVDQYEGRYGVEDMRQAVIEARMQGIHPFCLTIDRQAANYLPRVFGANQYAMLPKSEMLPAVLLDWMRRLLAARRH